MEYRNCLETLLPREFSINMAPVTVTFAITALGTHWSLRTWYVLKHTCASLPTNVIATTTTHRILTGKKRKKTPETSSVVRSIFKGTSKRKNLMAVLTINVGVFARRSFPTGNVGTEWHGRNCRKLNFCIRFIVLSTRRELFSWYVIARSSYIEKSVKDILHYLKSGLNKQNTENFYAKLLINRHEIIKRRVVKTVVDNWVIVLRLSTGSTDLSPMCQERFCGQFILLFNVNWWFFLVT
jgi:hypothetical protein